MDPNLFIEIQKGKIEYSYLQLLLEILPDIAPELSRGAIPFFFIIDTYSSNTPSLRSFPLVNEKDEERQNTKFAQVFAFVEDIVNANSEILDSLNISKSVNHVRSLMKSNNIPYKMILSMINEKSIALKGSVIDGVIIKEMCENLENNSHPQLVNYINNYIDKTNFKGGSLKNAYGAILIEALISTSHIEGEISHSTIKNISPVFMPLNALGTIRGLITWFVIGEEKAKNIQGEISKYISSGQAEALSAIYSQSILDVFFAIFMDQLKDILTTSKTEKKEKYNCLFSYLYPCRRAYLFKKHELVDINPQMQMVLWFDNESINEFFDADGVIWDLIYPMGVGRYLSKFRSQDDDSILKLHQGSVNRKLLDIFITASKEMEFMVEKEFGNIIRVFSHNIGNIFHSSGLLDIQNRAFNGNDIGADEAKSMICRLLPAWGSALAITSMKKMIGSNREVYLKSIVDHSYHEDDEALGFKVLQGKRT